jgi:hypothetical protein
MICLPFNTFSNMNGTTKQFTITPHKRQTRPSLAARLHHNQLLQQEQKEEYGASGTTQVLGAASKRRRATMAPEPVRQGNPIKVLLPRLEQLAQCMSTLEQNFKHLEGIDKALSSFNDAFSTFLQGMAMNAQCIVFPEVNHQPSIYKIRSLKGFGLGTQSIIIYIMAGTTLQ